MTRAVVQPMPSQEDSAQLPPPDGAPLDTDDGSRAVAHPSTLCRQVFIAFPATANFLLGSCISPHPIRVPSVCRAMTSPLRAGIPAFCCTELLTLSWCQMALEADDFISFKGARDLSAAPCRNQCASSSVGKPTRGAWHSSGYDPTKGPKRLGFQSSTANNLVSFTLSNPLCFGPTQ